MSSCLSEAEERVRVRERETDGDGADFCVELWTGQRAERERDH